MRVLYDHQIFNLQRRGGISRYHVALANLLSGMDGIDVSVLAPLHVNHFLAHSAHGGFPNFCSPRFGKLGRFPFRVNRLATRLAVMARAPDIFHATYFQADPFVIERSSRFVMTVYDMIHEKFPEAFAAGDPTAAWKHRLAMRADMILCISRQTRDDLLAILPVDPTKVRVTPLGFDPPAASAAGNSPSARPYLLFVGERTPHKNFGTLVRAYAGEPRLQSEFDLACFGGGALTDDERQLFHRLGGKPGRLLWAEGGDDLLARYYQHAAAFVMPSLYEGFGLPVLEAMARDCPVCCSRAGSLPEVAGDAAVYFDPHDPEEMASAILRAAGDPLLQRELRRKGRERLAEFSWARCAELTLEAYRSLT